MGDPDGCPKIHTLNTPAHTLQTCTHFHHLKAGYGDACLFVAAVFYVLYLPDESVTPFALSHLKMFVVVLVFVQRGGTSPHRSVHFYLVQTQPSDPELRLLSPFCSWFLFSSETASETVSSKVQGSTLWGSCLFGL